MDRQSNTDALFLGNYKGADLETLKRGIDSALRWAERHPDSTLVFDFRHHADLLRQEIKRRFNIEYK